MNETKKDVTSDRELTILTDYLIGKATLSKSSSKLQGLRSKVLSGTKIVIVKGIRD